MRMAEVADFSLLLLERLEELREHPQKYFSELLDWAEKTLKEEELAHFMQNSENEEGGFFREMGQRWSKWMDMHQHLPYSMARLACSSFHEGKWAGSEKAFEHAVGQEFARAFLLVLWPDLYESAEWVGWEEEYQFLEILRDDLSAATTDEEKDELTFGVFSKLNESAEFRQEVEKYAASAHEKKEVVSDVDDVENPTPRVSGFDLTWCSPLLYKWAWHAIFFAPIHQQLVESVFSTYDTCTQKHDSREIDIVRLGQFRSRQSRRVERMHATNKEIREAGDKALAVARALKKAASNAIPNERQLRKREHDWKKFLRDKSEKSKHGSKWAVKSVMEDEMSFEESESESDKSDELSCSSSDEGVSGDDAEL
ncbi:unnamed protein product [Ectocarpus sp. 4 AP-2014]